MSSMRFYPFLLLLPLALLLAACGAPPPALPTATVAETPTPLPPPTPESTPAEPEKMPSPTLPPELQSAAQQAVDILTRALDVSPDEVTILSVQRVQWSDSSLGCPKPGMMYAQVITPGYLVKAEARSEVHEIHLNDRGSGLVCPPDMAKPPIRVEE